MTTELKKNNNWGLIVGLITVAVIVLVLVFRKPSNPKADEKNSVNEDTKKTEDDKKQTTSEPESAPSVKTCWKRHTNDTSSFSLPTSADLGVLVRELQKFYNNDFISHAAAFCKGMDIEFSVAMVKDYRNEIRDFMKKTPKKINRDDYFHRELQNQVFNPGDLDCQLTTFSQHYLS